MIRDPVRAVRLLLGKVWGSLRAYDERACCRWTLAMTESVTGATAVRKRQRGKADLRGMCARTLWPRYAVDTVGLEIDRETPPRGRQAPSGRRGGHKGLEK